MSSVRRVEIESLPLRERALAQRLSESETIGDPDLKTLSDVEVARAWQIAESFSPDEQELLRALSRRLGVAPPPKLVGGDRVATVFGPPRADEQGRITRRTRIIATLGPSSNDVATLVKMIRAGMDVARINFSHVRKADDVKTLVENLHEAMRLAGREVRILADLPGPKIRVDVLPEKAVIATDATVTLGAGGLPVDPPSVLDDVKPGDRMFIDDGKIALRVTEVSAGKVMAHALRGGVVSSKKGINLPDSRLRERVPTKDDLAAIEIARSFGIHLFAASFIESAEDVERVRAAAGAGAHIVAKIERPQALTNLQEIAEAADALMVARGDLAVELGDAETPLAQSAVHQLGNALDVPTGTATQMMESMTAGSRPSRAEASDVYRSVVEGAEFVMTSGETALGDDPAAVLQEMAAIIDATERAAHNSPLNTLLRERARKA